MGTRKRKIDLLESSFPDGKGGMVRVTFGEWMSEAMHRRGLTNVEVWRRLRAYGFSGGKNNVSMWRTDTSYVSLETLPLLLRALDFTGDAFDDNLGRWVISYLPTATKLHFADYIEDRRAARNG